MRTAADRVTRSKGGHNTLSRGWKRKAKATRSKQRRQAAREAVNRP